VVRADAAKQVLVIYTTGRDTQFSITGDQMMPQLLERGVGSRIDYYAEFIDGARFQTADYPRAFSEYLKRKYRDAGLDAVITMHGLAFQFMVDYREQLFPETPVVFFTDDPESQRFRDSAGVIAARDYRATIDLARALQPETRDIFVIVGNSTRDIAAERVARAQFASYGSDLRFTYLSGLSNDVLEQRLHMMPPRAIGYYLFFHQDTAGTNVSPTEHLDRLLTVANRPVYSWVDATFGHGVLGGGFISITRQIEAVSDVAIRVLRGEVADSIPILTADTIENQVDWRQLQRWHIDESRVPAGTTVMFRSPTIWKRYRLYVIGASMLFIAQTGLIGALLIQRRRLRAAEEIVRHGEADLKESRERIRDLGGRLLAAQDAERSRIALELHDDISQQLAVLTMNLQLLCGFGSARDDDAEAVAREALEHADGIARSLRDLSHRLYPTKLRLLGLVPAIASLEHDMTSANLTIRFTHRDVPSGLPHDLTLALYRVVQEALHNAIAHSDAREVRVHLEGSGGALQLTIMDDGVGFEVERALGDGLGLIGMRERLDAVGGVLTISSTPGAGTRIEIVVPDTVFRATLAV
jgi:signal transduction histidine kinase